MGSLVICTPTTDLVVVGIFVYVNNEMSYKLTMNGGEKDGKIYRAYNRENEIYLSLL